MDIEVGFILWLNLIVHFLHISLRCHDGGGGAAGIVTTVLLTH